MKSPWESKTCDLCWVAIWIPLIHRETHQQICWQIPISLKKFSFSPPLSNIDEKNVQDRVSEIINVVQFLAVFSHTFNGARHTCKHIQKRKCYFFPKIEIWKNEKNTEKHYVPISILFELYASFSQRHTEFIVFLQLWRFLSQSSREEFPLFSYIVSTR